MALGDRIRRNIASVEPTERALLLDALIELNDRYFPGDKNDSPPGGVSWWFKQDEIHQATHVHGGPEFLPWHRELVNRLEGMLRQINPQLSLHYWDWTQDPRNIPNANLGGGTTGALNLFTPNFMGYGGTTSASIGQPWLAAGYYLPGAAQHRDNSGAVFPPLDVFRNVSGSPATQAQDDNVLNAGDFAVMRVALENIHDGMHGFVNMGGQHTSFRDPFVFLLHSNVDRLFSRWQTDPAHPERLSPNTVYGTETGAPGINSNVEPWSGGLSTRPWAAPENQAIPKTYKHPSIVTPPRYDTNRPALVVDNFGYNAGGWRVDKHPRLLADLTGDGRADIVGFGNAGVYVALNNGDGSFQAVQRVVDNFGYNAGGWRIDRHPRFLADLTGDGRADIVGFGYAGVYVALNNGDGSFQAVQKVVGNFGYNAGGWRVDRHPRLLADLTGDGRADIVGFGYAGVWTRFA